MSLVGIHIHDIIDIENDKNNNIHMFQFFVSAHIDYTHKKYQKIITKIKKHKIYALIHASYSINLAREWTSNDWWIQQFIHEIIACDTLGAFAIVVHTGKKLELSNSHALNNMYSSLLYIHESTIDHQNVKILLETPSGQGTEILSDIGEFCMFMNKFHKHPDKKIKNRFGICLDTCHIYASGYDLCNKTIITEYFDTIYKTIGLDKIKTCHINDSKGELGSALDRHANIGDGNMGIECITEICKFVKKLEIPIVLETHHNKIYDDYNIIVKL